MAWSNKIHVKGSLPKKNNQFSLFVGRWQPLHDGHKQLFQQVLDNGGNVCIAIRDVEPDEKNPFTATEVFANIHTYYKDLISAGRVKVMKVPDICSVDFGRGVGYDIVEWIPPTEIADISATKIREQMKQNGTLGKS
jgi:nicotinamide mononucleotide adenylyltransferase